MKLILTSLMVGVLSTFAFANDINPSTLSKDFLTHKIYFNTDKQTCKRNLSMVRSKFIRDYLVKQGVEHYRLSYDSLTGRYNLGNNTLEDIF